MEFFPSFDMIRCTEPGYNYEKYLQNYIFRESVSRELAKLVIDSRSKGNWKKL